MATIASKRVATKLLPKALRGLTKKRETVVQVLADDASVTATDVQWGGGSRSEYRDWNVKGTSEGTHRFYPKEGEEVPLAPGYARIETGTFCGKPATMRVYLRESDVAAFCGASCPLSAPPGIVADWCEDNGDSAAAARIREMVA